MHGNDITVVELIELLKGYEPNATVWLEGDDSDHKLGSIQEFDGQIILLNDRL